jgi:uncharacterized protein (UPF0335 family)
VDFEPSPARAISDSLDEKNRPSVLYCRIFGRKCRIPPQQARDRLLPENAVTEESSMATAAATREEAKEEPATRFAKDHLKAFVERIERLEEEKKAIADDIRDVYLEAKGTGFDVKALRTIVRLRKQDVEERKEQDAILETYMHALGMLA